MIPYADFPYFQMLVYLLVPSLVLGLFGLLNRGWKTVMIGGLLLAHFSSMHALRPGTEVRELLIVVGYAVYQALVSLALLRWRGRWMFWTALGLSVLPLALAKVLPIVWPQTSFGFLGISYVTFRCLDVLFSIQDGVIKELSLSRYMVFVLFVPTISSGPIDRYRKFVKEFDQERTRSMFLADLDAAVPFIARGFVYKFIIAALIKTHALDPVATGWKVQTVWAYMYAYTFYLFFDFAGYSAFAIGVGRIFGVKVPENFDKPFLAKNIRDFWNRWHISLSFWFRDHVYMRFLLAASKHKWFKGKHTSSYVGSFLTFGIMGVWHGLSFHYILYGLYHAVLLTGYDAFARWNKEAKRWPVSRAMTVANMVLTFHAVAFGLLRFSGRLTPPPPPAVEAVMERASATEITGWFWETVSKETPKKVDLYIDEHYIDRIDASAFRQDLKDRGFGKGTYGFRFEMPYWVKDGRPHMIEVKDAEGNRVLRGSPMPVQFDRDPEVDRLQKEKNATPGVN
jgi:membrane protein involved in D-alanine export